MRPLFSYGRPTDRGWIQLAQACKYSVAKMARHCQMSCRQFEREFQEHFGIPPKYWLRQQRAVAAIYLAMEDHQFKFIAAELHFRHVSHFCAEFKLVTGVTPSSFLKIAYKLRGPDAFS